MMTNEKYREGINMSTENFGRKISLLRKAKGLTQSQLAEMLNVSNKTISRWETGEGYPEISLLKPLAEALGTTVDNLLSDDSQKNEAPKEKTKINLGTSKEKREYKYEEVTVEWGALKQAAKLMLKGGKILPLVFFAVMTGVLISASHTSFKEPGYETWYYVDPKFGYMLMALIAAAAAVVLIYSIMRYRKGHISKSSMVLNLLATLAFTLGYIFSYKPVNAEFDNYMEYFIIDENASLFSCDYLDVNRTTMTWVSVIVVLAYLFISLIMWIIDFKKGNLYKFWQSLTVFNKVAFGSLMISLAFIVTALINVIFVMPGYLTSLAAMVPSVVCYIGLLAAIAGIVTSIADWHTRQLKGSIILAAVCFIARYIVPVLTMFLYMPVYF